MAVVQFTGGEKGDEVVAKLNQMSTEAGDTQQAKTAAVQAVSDAQGKVDLAEAALALAITAKNQAEAIALGDINGTNPDFASVKVAGVDVATANDISNIDDTFGLHQQQLTIIKRIARAGLVI